MKCLGMDLGTKTLGLAISDKSGTIASAYKLIRYVDINNLVKEVIEIINNKQIYPNPFIDNITIPVEEYINTSIYNYLDKNKEYTKSLINI